MRVLAWLWYPLSLAIIAIFGWLKLEQPFFRDQAMHHWVTRQMLEGAVLYRDAWDVKQPAIFLFHAVAVPLFESSPRGVHLLELCWMLLFAAAMMLLLRSYFRQQWLSAVAPLTFLAPYFAFLDPYAQSQAEGLAGLPLFLCAWVLWRAAGSDRNRVALALAAGVAAGVATAFKHILAPIPVTFVLIATWFALRPPRSGTPAQVLARLWLPFAAGVVAVWGTLFLWSAVTGGFDWFFWTNFQWPLENLEIGDKGSPARLIESTAVFIATLAPWLVLALATVGGLFRVAEPKLTHLMWGWLAAGFFVIFIQPTSWWAYHFILLYPPMGVLATRGIDRIVSGLLDRTLLSQGMATALAMLIVVLPLLSLLRPVGETARQVNQAFFVQHSGGEGFRRNSSPTYAAIAEVADRLRMKPPGRLYVVDDLNLTLIANREVGLPVSGQWLAALQLPQRWQHIPDQLLADPPEFFFIERRLAKAFAARYPALMAMLEQDYALDLEVPFGRLYERRPPVPALPPPGATPEPLQAPSGAAPGASPVVPAPPPAEAPTPARPPH
jgi:hypothetical protein